jgi:hypothetical protein
MLIEQKKRGPKKHKEEQASIQNEPIYSNLDFDTDFILNLEDPFQVPVYLQSQKKPQQTPLQIDPEVLNLYTQLNPKLHIQSELDHFLQSTLQGQQELHGPMNLTIAELPGVPSTFYMHLISMFFTYYHPSFPVLQEQHFMESLVPENKHHAMLLNTVYAIGCIYSRSAYLYQTPFYTPQKAFDYFVNRALAATPPPEVWGSEASDSLAICQASLLLSSCDFKTTKSYSWMMVGMALRLCLKFEMHTQQVEHDFFSLYTGIPKFHLKASNQERQRVWWSALLADLFLTISTGCDLTIQESEYVDTFIMPTARSKVFKNPITAQLSIKQQDQGFVIDQDKDKWMPFFSGFPNDTLFGAADINSEPWQKQSVGFFQIGHLYSNLQDISHVVQLSFLTRRAMRFANRSQPTNQPVAPSATCLYSLVDKSNEMHTIHDALMLWFENVPIELRLWKSLDVVLSEDIHAIDSSTALRHGIRLGSSAVLCNALFFSTIAMLHQTKCRDSPQPRFKLTSFLSNAGYESKDMVKLAYRGICYLLRRVYGQFMPPSLTYIPPSEIVSSSIISALIMPIALAMLSISEFVPLLLTPKNSSGVVDRSGIDSLETVILPCLDNIGQVWPVAYTHATHLRHVMEKIQQSIGGYVAPEKFVVVETPVFETQEKSWYDLRNEFEDEFLL